MSDVLVATWNKPLCPIDDAMFLATMRTFWEKGITRVSPGAFGMACGFGCQPRPLEKSDLDVLVLRCPAASWLTDEVGNVWIVKVCD